MADGRTTLTKPMAGLLQPGEELLGGCKASGRGAVVRAAYTATIGASLSGDGHGPDGLAGVVPQDRVFWVGATTRRLVYWGVGALTSTPKALRGESPLEVVHGGSLTPGRVLWRLELAFTDGTSTAVDLYRANSPQQLQDALDRVLPGRIRHP